MLQLNKLASVTFIQLGLKLATTLILHLVNNDNKNYKNFFSLIEKRRLKGLKSSSERSNMPRSMYRKIKII